MIIGLIIQDIELRPTMFIFRASVSYKSIDGIQSC
jgi:hypothetical protein